MNVKSMYSFLLALSLGFVTKYIYGIKQDHLRGLVEQHLPSDVGHHECFEN